jgi:hypothetical protein
LGYELALLLQVLTMQWSESCGTKHSLNILFLRQEEHIGPTAAFQEMYGDIPPTLAQALTRSGKEAFCVNKERLDFFVRFE